MKTKPEPLKGKEMNQDNYIIGSEDKVFYGVNIKQAVEWLKENIRTPLSKTGFINANEANQLKAIAEERCRILDLIDKAFQDVTTKPTKEIQK